MNETGAGKELVAEAVHKLSPRADKPLVTVIELPPLRERLGDIPLLARHFIEQLAGHAAGRLSLLTPGRSVIGPDQILYESVATGVGRRYIRKFSTCLLCAKGPRHR